MPPGGRRRTPADVAHPPSLYDSRETDLTASPPSVTDSPMQLQTTGNENTTIQSRRLAPRAREVARLPRLLGARTFRLSKWLLGHFFHRKEFRRKGNAVRDGTFVRPANDARDFPSRGSTRGGRERTSRELSINNVHLPTTS